MKPKKKIGRKFNIPTHHQLFVSRESERESERRKRRFVFGAWLRRRGWALGMESHVPSNRNETWTEEKHVHFLNSMEAWFVNTMLQSNDRYNLRLDRHLPDSSDSTLDCKPRTKHSTPAVHFIGKTRSKMKKSRPVKRSMRSSSQPHDSSQDQVVPQLKN
ncbi:uncharacterized protein LOC105791181 isoform X3 [Gossypium raimondii]|uniref:uncharacterized protein LOC105791181 isoform X3 n=1 Tax=Gossypium raimondii TaxID=29730 RepID=UPI00063B088E|nr:uncharacterized protein LOC105791181 isoform X3 [Gossypium raimondii]